MFQLYWSVLEILKFLYDQVEVEVLYDGGWAGLVNQRRNDYGFVQIHGVQHANLHLVWEKVDQKNQDNGERKWILCS